MNKVVNSLFIYTIKFYQITLSPLLGGSCRFHPTCSRYGIDAFRAFSFFKAFALTAKRISKCHPFSAGGFDPTPK
ncbi:MAG TPA: membrane protein insertion efficiency factor YidD [Candidatus Marinimicrobia bacterium]|nr:membrane protein insertion efficiency factor YidD [Candidatus Neomarinimicrobiota bacterium]